MDGTNGVKSELVKAVVTWEKAKKKASIVLFDADGKEVKRKETEHLLVVAEHIDGGGYYSLLMGYKPNLARMLVDLLRNDERLLFRLSEAILEEATTSAPVSP